MRLVVQQDRELLGGDGDASGVGAASMMETTSASGVKTANRVPLPIAPLGSPAA